jgi:hypothetical protein
MSLNGSGVFSVNSAGQPVVSGTLITAAAFNAAMQDIATALSTALYKDGQQLNAANQAMGGFKLTGLAAGSTAGDSVRYEQVLLLAGGNMTGGLNGKLTTVASHATTADIFATTVGNLIDWTGTATTTAFAAAPQAGAERTLICAAAAVFTAGANMLIDGVASGDSFTATAGDKVIVRAVTTTQFRLTIQRYAGTAEPYVLIQEQQASGTNGGAFNSGAWRTRPLNTEVKDTPNSALASNQVTLQPGTYRYRGWATAYFVNLHKVRFQNITDGTTDALGASGYSAATGSGAPDRAEVSGRVTITSAKVFELQHQCQASQAVNGFGPAASLGTEIYSQLEIWEEI